MTSDETSNHTAQSTGLLEKNICSLLSCFPSFHLNQKVAADIFSFRCPCSPAPAKHLNVKRILRQRVDYNLRSFVDATLWLNGGTKEKLNWEEFSLWGA